ncbi:hypothetical protein Tsp_09864 [Trichinella spiralis]|uniref:hypothetical protein n=1 Tax=Trichinella spiralis TaxID=6334 RepID=UPI0001EFDC0B|nr:hypothetical protein Tsp_09864 [Trichinella spiralis]
MQCPPPCELKKVQQLSTYCHLLLTFCWHHQSALLLFCRVHKYCSKECQRKLLSLMLFSLSQICSDAVAKGDFNTMAKSTTDKLPTAALAHSYLAGTGIGDF